MDKLCLKKLNESYIKVICERDVAQELSQYFTFKVPGYQFTPEFKSKVWDGNIRLFNLRTYTIYAGLLEYIKKFCKDRSYELEIDDDLSLTDNFSVVEAESMIQKLKIPHEVRDYQLDSFVHGIRDRRMLLLSPTASGKSLIIYLWVCYFQYVRRYKRGLLIVPTISLVSQMFSDFKSYGYNSDKHCHMIYQGQDKNDPTKFLYISTWQSIYKMPSDYFEQFDFVIGDEAHSFKAKSLTTILSACVNSKHRLGCTGTLDGTQTHKLVLEGLFGPVRRFTTTSELMQNKHLSQMNIKCLILKYPKEIAKLASKWDYQTEIQYLISNDYRNKFITNLSLSLQGNTLILFNLVQKHGKKLFQMIKEKAGNRKVFFVFGGTDVEVRESIRSIVETEKDAIICASYGVFSTGVNIRNLHNVIFASPSKSRIRNLQSIGRVLRTSENKTEATLYDIADDLKYGKRDNHTLKHFISRVTIYDQEKFNYKFYNIEVKS